MAKTARCGLLAVMLFGMVGCASNKEALAEKDRLLNEQHQKNLALRRQLDDADTTRRLLERQYEAKKGELDQLQGQDQGERERLQREIEDLRKQLAASNAKKAPAVDINDPDVQVETRANGDVVLRVSNEVTFSPGSAQLSRKGQQVLRSVAKVLKRHKTFGVAIEGHTDDVPLKKSKTKWGTNLNLSIARAIKVRDFLAKAAGVRSARMHVEGYGSTRPLVSGKTKIARAKNRRVEIVLMRTDD